jgi:putative ABC transport system ATP-binding protein
MFNLQNVKYKNILLIDKLDMQKNKVTCIVGESGSGKSTILRLLNDIISPDSGEIYYNGTSLKDINPVLLRRKVVMLPQNPVVIEGNVKDNLVAGLRFCAMDIPKDDELLNMMSLIMLNKSLDESPEKFSGGEKQRMALARVLLMKPEVLLLDEPSSALDEKTEGAVIDNVVDYTRKSAISLIMVTHSKRVAQTYGEEVIEIKNGRILDK